MQDLEWCANWKMDNRYYCSVLSIDPNRKPTGFHSFLENMFGNKYGGFRYDHSRNGFEIWFRNREDMLTFKLLSANRN